MPTTRGKIRDDETIDDFRVRRVREAEEMEAEGIKGLHRMIDFLVFTDYLASIFTDSEPWRRWSKDEKAVAMRSVEDAFLPKVKHVKATLRPTA